MSLIQPASPHLASFAARTPTLPPATHTNSYALGDREVLLVEPATPHADEQHRWLEWARSFPVQGRRLVAVLVTHHHPDHVGGAALLARALEVPLWAHAATAERLGEVPVARRLEEGESLVLDGPAPQRWQVLHTPGHAPGHLCLHEPALGALVVGDMVASQGTIVVGPDDGDMQVYLEQLERLAALGARQALPAHGDPIDEPEQLFLRYIRHRLWREAKVLTALASFGQAAASLEELVARAYDDTPESVWPLAAYSLRAHLIKLGREGRVSRIDDEYRLS